VKRVEGAAGARPGDEDPPESTLFPPHKVAGSDLAQEQGRQKDTPTKSQPLFSSRSKKQTAWEAVCKGQFGTHLKCLTTEPRSLGHGAFSLAHHPHFTD